MKTSCLLLFLILLCSACEPAPEDTEKKELSNQQKDPVIHLNCDSIWNSIQKAKADTIANITSIPENFEASLQQLDTLIGEPMKGWIRCLPDQEFGNRVHHGLGTYLRNNWGLWKSSRLAKALRAMGMLHPDDMTAIIFDSYQRRLKGEDIRLEEQIKYYRDFWQDTTREIYPAIPLR